MFVCNNNNNKNTDIYFCSIQEYPRISYRILYSLFIGILESSKNTLEQGHLLLEKIKQMGMHADVQNRHATTAACYGIEHLLELLHDRRRHLEDLWLRRKNKLEQCLQLCLLDQEVFKVSRKELNSKERIVC